MKTKFSEALKVVTKALKKDPSLRESYKANIAMAFKDEYSRQKQKKSYLNQEDIHEIANKSAEDFLKLWCS